MGMLVDGVWKDVWYDTTASGGAFVRHDAAFRDVVEDAPGSRFRAEPGRYHLYVSWACPWAHRTMIVRALMGLQGVIGASVVDPLMRERGWTFGAGPGGEPEPLFGARTLHEIYTRARPDYTGRVTVPVLWDRKEATIVNNESAEILRILNHGFARLATEPCPDLYPAALRAVIDPIEAHVYDTVNNGVYKAGFATAQPVYEQAVRALFSSLDGLEALLGGQPWLAGDRLTEADLRLFTTLVRFDAVYHGHFKCNLRRLVDYPNLWDHTRALHQVPAIGATVRFDHVKQHYYGSHPTINPTGIVPLGPLLDFSAPVSPARARPLG
ncbi:MAG: glutathione S-transferase family protein [Polyangiales bacterium]